MAILCAYDDGRDTGETVRIRVPTFVIGRSSGDLVIPHDGGISGRHAEIARRGPDGRSRWWLRDLGSTNGTFVRTARASLDDRQELLIGGARYRFEHPDGAAVPRLVEVPPQGGGASFAIQDDETWIGRDPNQCAIVVDRPWVSPRHAVIRARRGGRWIIERGDGGDGLWMMVQEIDLGRGGQFQCGEQRFLFRVL
jgi:pSer/pThr/pTyr-binding forkhead associated (FHA) protein